MVVSVLSMILIGAIVTSLPFDKKLKKHNSAKKIIIKILKKNSS